MIVHNVTLERPLADRPGLIAMATVRTDRGTFVFAARSGGRTLSTGYRFNEAWRPAFTLPPDDERVIAEAIRDEIESDLRGHDGQRGTP